MNKKLLAYAFLPVVGFGFLGADVVWAHGFFGNNLTLDEIAARQQTVFQNEATLLSITVDAVKSGWAQGKNIQQIAQDHGIIPDQLQQKMKDARTQRLKIQFQALVGKGIITQAQADQRLEFLQNRKGRMGREFRGGFPF